VDSDAAIAENTYRHKVDISKTVGAQQVYGLKEPSVHEEHGRSMCTKERREILKLR